LFGLAPFGAKEPTNRLLAADLFFYGKIRNIDEETVSYNRAKKYFLEMI